MLNAKGMTHWSVIRSTFFSADGDQQSCLMTSLSPFSLQRPSKCFRQLSPPPHSHPKEAIPSLQPHHTQLYSYATGNSEFGWSGWICLKKRDGSSPAPNLFCEGCLESKVSIKLQWLFNETTKDNVPFLNSNVTTSKEKFMTGHRIIRKIMHNQGGNATTTRSAFALFF